MKRAIIVGAFGQDGSILYDYLSTKNYALVGLGKNRIKSTNSEFKNKSIDIKNESDINELISGFLPDEVYHFAAYHHSSEDVVDNEIELFKESYETNVLSLITVLEAIRTLSPESRLFYAASSLMFKNTRDEEQSESTKYEPACIYGITKTSGVHLCQYYRNKFNVFAAAGFFYNHESTLRKPMFLSKKIIKTAVAIKNGDAEKLIVGALNGEVDWGYAPDYMEAVNAILQLDTPEDFIISSGSTHTVKDFVQVVFNYLNLDWTKYVEENSDLLYRKGSKLQGNNQKLRSMTGWKPKHTFQQFIEKMVDEELRQYESK